MKVRAVTEYKKTTKQQYLMVWNSPCKHFRPKLLMYVIAVFLQMCCSQRQRWEWLSAAVRCFCSRSVDNDKHAGMAISRVDAQDSWRPAGLCLF